MIVIDTKVCYYRGTHVQCLCYACIQLCMLQYPWHLNGIAMYESSTMNTAIGDLDNLRFVWLIMSRSDYVLSRFRPLL